MGNEGVIAVEKALALLDCFRPGEESLTLTALAQLSGYHKTTVYRLMNSLERMNYVIRRDNGVYTLGPRLLYLASSMNNPFIWPVSFSLNFTHWRLRQAKAPHGM